MKAKLSGGKQVGSLADRFDAFYAPVPNFNLEGVTRTGSFLGLFFTVGVYTIMLMYVQINV